MLKFIRQLFLVILTIILIGGISAPALAQEASTTYHFTAFNYPYNLITDEQGKTTQVPWYPDADAQSVTIDQINANPDFTTQFPQGGTRDDVSYNVAVRMRSMADPTINRYPVNADDNWAKFRSIYAPVYDISDPNTLVTFMGNYDYIYTWLFKACAQINLHQTSYNTVYSDYLENVLPRAIDIDAVYPHFGLVESIGGSEGHPAGILKNAATLTDQAPYMIHSATSFHLTAPTARLANLDPESSALREEKLLQRPIKDFTLNPIKESKESSETNETLSNVVNVVADGQLSTDFNPTCFVFKNPPAPVVGSQNSRPVTIHYVDDQGNALKPDKILTGSLGETYQAEPLNIDGYTLVKTSGQESGSYTGSEQSVTYTYHKNAAVVVNNSVIYATKKIHLYSSPTFTKKAVKRTYAKKSRMNRPMFKIIGTATSNAGAKRYRVQDLNGKETTGYVTTRPGYVAPAYYANKPAKITVINPKGLNARIKKDLTGKATHYKQGQVLKVKKIVSHNLTTRFVLSNGKFISANKKLVIAGKYAMPKRVQTKTAINRYGTANLSKKNKHIAKGTALKVTGWAYSNPNNFRKGDTLRYKVAGGYITGNKQFVRIIH